MGHTTYRYMVMFRKVYKISKTMSNNNAQLRLLYELTIRTASL